MKRIDFIKEITDENRQKWTKYKDFDRHILLNITHCCNYNCSYCFYLQNGQHAKQHYKLDDALEVIEIVMNTFPGESICWFIIGGEPTQYPLQDMITILEKISEYGRCIVELQSNGSASLEYYETILPYLDCCDFSYHHMYCKDFEHFFNMIDLFYRNDKLENIDLMFPMNVDDKFIENTRKLLKYKDHIEATYSYFGNRETDSRGHSFYNEIKKHIHQADHLVKFQNDDKIYTLNKSDLYQAQINCKGMYCSSMSKYIAINGDGTFAPCGTSLIQNNKKEMGNLLKHPEIFKLRTKTIHKCNEEECLGEWYNSLKRT